MSNFGVITRDGDEWGLATIIANIRKGKDFYFDCASIENDFKIESCANHLKTIMIAVKEGADVEVIVKPKVVAGAPTSFTPNSGHPYGNIPTPPVEFDEKLHDTIIKLMARSGNLYETDTIIETARQICDACKIKP